MNTVRQRITVKWALLLSGLALIAARLFVSPTPAEAASTEVTASCLPASSENYYQGVFDNSSSVQTVAQYFTPSASGTVSSVQVTVWARYSPNNLIVQLVPVTNGQPEVTAEAPFATVSPSAASTISTLTLGFSSSVSVTAGQLYALVFSTPQTSTQGNWAVFTSQNACAGDTLESAHGGSYALIEYVNPVAFSVSVTSATIPVTGVTLNESTLALTAGGATAQLQATVTPADATNPSVTWSSSNTAVATVSSTGVVTPVAAGTATITATTVDGGYTASSAVTVDSSVPVSQPPAWIPPVLVPEPITVGSAAAPVLGNLGYNPTSAIDHGTAAGYAEERAAIEAGATASGEGIDLAYLSAILDGSGVGWHRHVSAAQQGQFAALYQKLGIIPTWTHNTVSIADGVSTLVKAGASSVAIENYLVQLDGFSWSAAMAQAQAGFPIQAGTA